MTFEWDEEKNRINIKKHGVSFELASKVFLDSKRIEKYDIEHSSFMEDRYRVIGFVERVLLVIYTERRENIRLISARPAEPNEEAEYYENYDIRGN